MTDKLTQFNDNMMRIADLLSHCIPLLPVEDQRTALEITLKAGSEVVAMFQQEVKDGDTLAKQTEEVWALTQRAMIFLDLYVDATDIPTGTAYKLEHLYRDYRAIDEKRRATVEWVEGEEPDDDEP